MTDFTLRPIGVVRSGLTDRKNAPRQGYEGAPDAVVEVHAEFLRALDGIKAGNDLLLVTWFHEGRRDVLEVWPLEAIDGTPVVDIKPVLDPVHDR